MFFKPKLFLNALRSARLYMSLSLFLLIGFGFLPLFPIEHWSIVQKTNGGLVQSRRAADAASIFPRKTKGKLFSNPKSSRVRVRGQNIYHRSISMGLGMWVRSQGKARWRTGKGREGLVSGNNSWKVVFHAAELKGRGGDEMIQLESIENSGNSEM